MVLEQTRNQEDVMTRVAHRTVPRTRHNKGVKPKTRNYQVQISENFPVRTLEKVNRDRNRLWADVDTAPL